MELRLSRRMIPFVVFAAAVVFAVYGYGIHLVIDAVNNGASQNQLLLLALMIAGAIGGLCFAFSWSLLLRHRIAVRRIERRFTAKTGIVLGDRR